MDVVSETAQLVEQFKQSVETAAPPFAQASRLLSDIKVRLIQFKSLPPAGMDSPTAQREKMIARTALEYATLLSVRMEDGKSFDRHIAQLKSYYANFTDLPQSDLLHPILGLNLLHLLVESRLADFHTELQLIDESARGHPCVAFPLQLERHVMEGSYNKVLAARASLPHKYFQYYMDRLANAVREEIAECVSRAYERIGLDHARRLLFFDTDRQLREYVVGREGWEVVGSDIVVRAEAAQHVEVPAQEVIHQTLHFATELERIV